MLRAACVVCCALSLVATCSAVDVISASKLQACSRDGSQTLQTLDCAQKLVVTLSVDTGDTVSNSDLQFGISCVNNTDGVCPCSCSYITDPGCSCRDLQQQVTVSLTKSPLFASYPLTYLQSFNYKPYEKLIVVQSKSCKDGALDPNPTCGWYWVNAQKQEDSQGFCCDCTLSSIWDDTFGSASQKSRAGLNCDFFSDPFSGIIGRYPSSASCLEFDPLWYGGYSLGEAMLDFEIQLNVRYTNVSSNANISEVLTLSPFVPVALTSTSRLAAKLLGDLAGYTQLPTLSSKLLMIPRPVRPQSLSDVLGNRTNWMLVDRSMVSFDGTQCDKVGTSFTAFRYHSDRCKRAPQTCLSNQLKDLYQSDLQRTSEGKVPLYLMSQYTYGLSSAMKRTGDGGISFALPVPFKRSSIVVLETTADTLQFVTNVSPGNLSAARMCQFSGSVCGGFEASASRGFLHANVTNTGTLPASYTLSVTNCSANIRPVEAQKLGLAAGATVRITPFEIYVEDDRAQEGRFCWLVLFDAKLRQVDQAKVVFYTNATAYDTPPTGGNNQTGSTPGNRTARDCSACKRNEMSCIVRNRCWSKFGGMLGWMGGALLGVLLLALALKAGWLAEAASKAMSLFSSRGNSSGGRKAARSSQRFIMYQPEPGGSVTGGVVSMAGAKQLQLASSAAGAALIAAGGEQLAALSQKGRAMFDSASGWQPSGQAQSSQRESSMPGKAPGKGATIGVASVNPLFGSKEQQRQEGTRHRQPNADNELAEAHNRSLTEDSEDDYGDEDTSGGTTSPADEGQYGRPPDAVARVARAQLPNAARPGSKGPPPVSPSRGGPGRWSPQAQQQQRQAVQTGSRPPSHAASRTASSSGQASPSSRGGQPRQMSAAAGGGNAELRIRRGSSSSDENGNGGDGEGPSRRQGSWSTPGSGIGRYSVAQAASWGPPPLRPPLQAAAAMNDRSGRHDMQQQQAYGHRGLQQQQQQSTGYAGPHRNDAPRSPPSSRGSSSPGGPHWGYGPPEGTRAPSPPYIQPHRLHVQSSPGAYLAGPPPGYGSSMGAWGSSPGAVPGAAMVPRSLARPMSPSEQLSGAPMVPGRAYPAAVGARPAGHFNLPLA